MALQRLKDAAEKAKKDLSGVATTQISLPFITAGPAGPLHLEVTLSRAKFDELTADLVERTMGPTRQALSDAGLSASELDKVILVGGSTRIPAVQEAIKKATGKEPHRGGQSRCRSIVITSSAVMMPASRPCSSATASV